MSSDIKNAALVLENGKIFLGYGIGYPRTVSGEVVFTTGMVGYLRSLTDPSYYGQILVFTYPLIGNYGVPNPDLRDKWGLPKFFESDGIKVRGVVVFECCKNPSHWSSYMSLDEWLKKEKVPGIEGIDTRELTLILREKGTMLGILDVRPPGSEPDIDGLLSKIAKIKDPNEENLVSQVSISDPIELGYGRFKIVLIDCGVKYNILRCLLNRGVKITRVPWNWTAEEILELKPDGVVISNGPGDPRMVPETVETTRALIDEGVPMLGICLGNQLIALACGAKTFKLKYGHRGLNKPVIDLKTLKSFVTSQNHGYAVDISSIPPELEVSYINADDKTVEGLIHLRKHCLSVQFHPEHNPGPWDAEWIFDYFLSLIRRD